MTLPTRPLGSSGLDITTVGFGAWSGGAEAGEPAERLYFQRRGLARASHRERSGISAGPRRCPIGPPAAVLQQWEHPMPSQRNDLQHSAVVVIDMANDFVYSGGVIADAGGPDYQQRAQRLSHRWAACSPRRGVPASRWCTRPTPTRRATASSGSGRRMPWQAVGTPRSSPDSRLSPATSCSANRLTARS